MEHKHKRHKRKRRRAFSQEEYDERVRKSRKYLSLSTANVFLTITATFMIIYSYVDNLDVEFQEVLITYGAIGTAHEQLRYQGAGLLFITFVTLISLLYVTLIIHYVYVTLILAMMVIHMKTANNVYGDDRVGSIQLKLNVIDLSFSKDTEDIAFFNYIQSNFECCNTTEGDIWLDVPPESGAQCCPTIFVDPLTSTCIFELSFQETCDNVVLKYTRSRVWKYYFMFCGITFIEFVSLTCLIPASFQAQKGTEGLTKPLKSERKKNRRSSSKKSIASASSKRSTSSKRSAGSKKSSGSKKSNTSRHSHKSRGGKKTINVKKIDSIKKDPPKYFIRRVKVKHK